MNELVGGLDGLTYIYRESSTGWLVASVRHRAWSAASACSETPLFRMDLHFDTSETCCSCSAPICFRHATCLPRVQVACIWLVRVLVSEAIPLCSRNATRHVQES
jgi:hypothetical protein